MVNKHTAIKQKSHIIIDAGGSFLKSAVLNDDGTVHASSYFVTKSHSDNDGFFAALFRFLFAGRETCE